MVNRGEINELREAYKKLNNSFEPVLIFHIGESAGFFSEYNCMIFSMLYCLQHRIQFKLYSKDANFGYEHGWTDFFEPFCEEESSRWHHWINMRPTGHWLPVLKMKDFNLIKWKLKKSFSYLIAKVWTFCHPKRFLTQDLWYKALSKDQLLCEYDIPELKIKGNIVHACEILVNITWSYRKDISDKLQAYIGNLHLLENYISCQIRAGDKYLEFNLLSVDVYIDYLKKYPNIKDVFILTDDYSILKQLKANYTQWNWYTLCETNEHGYIHSEFRQISKMKKKEQLIKFFASIEIIHSSDVFIGTITSNPSVFSSLRDPCKTYFVDYGNCDFPNILI